MDRFRMLPNYQYHDDDTGILETQYKKEMRDYQIFGNSVQDGTPSPDNPIEIQSVGEKTANLSVSDTTTAAGGFGVDFKQYGNGYKATATRNTGGYNNWCRIPILHLSNLKWGQTYTLSFYVEQSNPNMSSLLRPGYTNNLTNSFYAFINKTVANNTINSITFTLPGTQPETFGKNNNTSFGSDWIYLFINVQIAALDTYESIAITDIMLVEGDTPAEYEPANKYKIPIEVSRKNLFNINNIVQYESRSGYGNHPVTKVGELLTFEGRKGYHNSNLLPLNKDSIIYVSGEVIGTDTFNMNVVKTTGDKTSFTNLNPYYYNITGSFIYKFTIPDDEENFYGLNIYSSGAYNSSNGIRNFQISIINDGIYEPYQEPQIYNIFLDEPLRKCGDYADYIDFRNGKLVRNIREFILDGSVTNNFLLNWRYAEGYYATGYFEAAFPGLKKISGNTSIINPILCNKLVGISYGDVYNNINPVEGINLSNNSTYSFFVRIKVDNVTTKDEWWNYLNENPLTIVAPIAEAVEESVELPQPLLNKGTNIIKVKTSTQPSQVNWQYYK